MLCASFMSWYANSRLLIASSSGSVTSWSVRNRPMIPQSWQPVVSAIRPPRLVCGRLRRRGACRGLCRLLGLRVARFWLWGIVLCRVFCR